MIRMAKEHPLFEEVKFCALPISKLKSEMRQFLKGIQVTPGRIAGTDGKRVHAYRDPDIDIPEGFYEVVKNTTKEIWLDKVDVEYPDLYLDLWEADTDQNIYTLTDELHSFEHCLFEICNAGIVINPDFLKACMGVGEMDVHIKDRGHPIVLKSDSSGFSAYIMPIGRGK